MKNLCEKFIIGGGNRRRAFTLAEVLIILGIIGVVASLTLPVLISKYKHKELETRFKKSYSLISQASQGMEMELGSCERDQADNIVQYIADEFKVIKSGNFAKRELGYQFKTYNLEATNPVIHPNCFDFAGQVPYLYLITADGTTVALCTNNHMGLW